MEEDTKPSCEGNEEEEEDINNSETAQQDPEPKEEETAAENTVEDDDASASDALEIPIWEGPLRWTPSVAVGLANLGNTCYLNSILQALLHCPSVVAFFSHNWPSIAPPEFYIGNRSRNEFANDFALLIQRVWSAGVQNERLQKFYNPMSVYRGVIRAVPEFRENGQQDAQEALNYILNNLHDELTIEIPAICHPARSVLERLEAEQRAWNRDHKHRKSSTASQSAVSSDSSGDGHRRTRKKSKFRMRSRSQKDQQPDETESTTDDLAKPPLPPPTVTQIVDKGGENGKVLFRQLEAPYQQSVISDTFQTLLVQRVMCKRCGYTSLSLEEYFELSLALPSKQQVKEMKRALEMSEEGGGNTRERSSSGSSASGTSGTVWSAFKSLKSFVGLDSQSLSLRECLQAFFTAEQLVNDDQYYCEKCKRKQDAEKSHSFAHSPEIICLNLKRFNRNGGWSLNSYKNLTPVSYPLYDLDLSEFFYYPDQQQSSEDKEYDLLAVVRHSGGINGGHYIAYCKNPVSHRWYEYDDDICCPIDEAAVQTNDAYLLFYKKKSTTAHDEKCQALLRTFKGSVNAELPERSTHYISQYWTLKWDTLVNPGTCGTFDTTCAHGKLLPHLSPDCHFRMYSVSKEVWQVINQHYGCGPLLKECVECETCTAERVKLQDRRDHERETIREAAKASVNSFYIIHNGWVKSWTSFVHNTHHRTGRGHWLGRMPPGKVSNDCLLDSESKPKKNRRKNSDYLCVNKEIWDFFMNSYGGGPALYSPSQDLYQLAPVPVSLDDAEDAGERAKDEKEDGTVEAM